MVRTWVVWEPSRDYTLDHKLSRSWEILWARVRMLIRLIKSDASARVAANKKRKINRLWMMLKKIALSLTKDLSIWVSPSTFFISKRGQKKMCLSSLEWNPWTFGNPLHPKENQFEQSFKSLSRVHPPLRLRPHTKSRDLDKLKHSFSF